jgi:hypothetical protein
MKIIIDFLRKIGLLRMSKGDFQTGEFDNRSDLKTKKPNTAVDSGVKNSSYFAIFATVGGVMMLLFLVIAGLNFWFFLMLAVWAWFLWLIKKWIALGAFAAHKTIFIGIGIAFLTFIFMGISMDNKGDSTGSESSKKTDSSSYIINEAYSAEMSARNQFVDAETNTKTVSVWVNANIRMYTPDPYESVSIKNVELEKDLPGKVMLSIPAGGYSEKYSKNNVIEYKIVEEENMEPKTVLKNRGYLSIQLKANNAYKFDTNKAFGMSTNGIGPSKTFQYVGLKAEDLDNTLEFDLDIEFESGKKKTVHFVGEIDGAKFLEKGGVGNIEMKVAE